VNDPDRAGAALKARIIGQLRGTTPAADVAAAALALYPREISATLFPAPLTPAAVLVPIVERGDGLTVLLTRRADHLRDHPGQISLPGGRIGATDGEPLAAALRETQEELGITPALIEVAGYLPPHAVITGFAVTPVVGFLPAVFDLRPEPLEVAEAFEVPLAFLADAGNAHAGRRRLGDIELPVWEYRYGGHRIWGATAQILKTLMDKIS
jgi:8-oxo-dGTP pyrophosphatase MutT (NUDIX family)